MTRKEHLDWAKQRALDLLGAGKLHEAFDSMASDLSKHPDTRDHSAILLGAELLLNGHLNDSRRMRDFIEGFN